jgi:hypothetical protein
MSQNATREVDQPTERAAIRLHCLAGQPPSPPVLSDWERLTTLPERAQESLWELVEASISSVDPALERRADAFCQLYGVAPGDLQASLRVCRLLLSRAASLNLPTQRLIEDMTALSKGQPSRIATAIAERYGTAKSLVQRGLVERMILDHGKVLAGLDWRVDRIAAADRGVGLDSPVVLLTLRLRDGDREERSTFYLTPPMFRELKAAFDGIDTVLAATTSGAATSIPNGGSS